MTATAAAPSSPVACSAAEWDTRCELAALFRVLDLYGMTDLGNQVVGARVKDDPDHYLLHPYGMFYEEVTASSLVKTGRDGVPVDAGAPTLNDGGQNLVQWIFGARPEVNYFVHGHCEDVMAVGSTRGGLKALSQPAVYLMHLVTYIDYEFSEDAEFGAHFVNTLGAHEIMISRNHGYYALGRTAAEAFFRAYYLRQACAVQVKVMAMRDKPHLIDRQEVARFQDQMYASPDYHYDGSTEWTALLRKLEREQPDYRT